MKKEKNYDNYNFKNMLINALKMFEIDECYLANNVLLQDITAFLLDNGYECFNYDWCIQISGMDTMDKFIDYYNSETLELYNFLVKYLNVEKSDNYISIERINSDNQFYSLKDASSILNGMVYYKGNINNIIDDNIKNNMNRNSDLYSRKIVIFNNNNYTIRYVTQYTFEKKVKNYNFNSALFTCMVDETIETFTDDKVVNMVKQIINQTSNDFDLANPSSGLAKCNKKLLEKRIYNVNNNMVDFNLLSDGGYCSDTELDIKFSVPLSYDIWSLDYCDVDMELYKKDCYGSVYSDLYEDYENKFIINTLVFSQNMKNDIDYKIQEDLYNNRNKYYIKRI